MPASHYGKPGSTITGAKRRAVVDDITAGELGRNAIAKKHGLSGSTVSGIAKAEGLEFRGRSQVAAATTARKVDLAAVRAELIAGDYEYLRKIQRDRISTSHKTLIKAKGGAEREVTLDFVPPLDARNFADTYSRISQSVHRMAEIDADPGVNDASTMLRQLGRQLGIDDSG